MDVTTWLSETDPALRWQVMRDLQGQPEERWAPVRAEVEHQGWGARLLACQGSDGLWDGGTFFPDDFSRATFEREGQPWSTTAHVLDELRELGLPPRCAAARHVVDTVGRNGRWDADGAPFWQGEVEECINGRTVATGAYFGLDMSPLVERLVGEQQGDGGWNCERAAGSRRSSFHTTINVLEGLWGFEEVSGGTPASREARAAGEEYLLRRGLFRRLSTGEVADLDLLLLRHPDRWYYSVLRALDYFRRAHTTPDARIAEAVADLRARQGTDGRWPLDVRAPGRVWFHLDGDVGEPSRWVTLRAARVLAWARRPAEAAEPNGPGRHP